MFNECHIHLCDCTWLNVFSQTQSLLIKHKKIFECFSCFWIVLCFCKNCQNLQKQCYPVLALSHGLVQSHAPIASPHRDFSQLTSRSMSQSRKILGIFFKIWVFNVSHGSDRRLIREWRFQSRGYSEIFVAYFVTLSRVELPVAKNT